MKIPGLWLCIKDGANVKILWKDLFSNNKIFRKQVLVRLSRMFIEMCRQLFDKSFGVLNYHAGIRGDKTQFSALLIYFVYFHGSSLLEEVYKNLYIW